MMYLERLSSYGIEQSPFFKRWGNSNDMPNCTRYAYDRAQESCNDPNLYIARATSGFGEAKNWWEQTTYPKGSEIRDGSIAVFDGQCGHVMYVERAIDKTHGLCSQSQWSDDKTDRGKKYWEKEVFELIVGQATLEGIGVLKGFIYCPINDIRTARGTNEQIEIIEEMVNVRTSPEGSLTCPGCYCPMGIYNVLDSQELNGFKWFKLDSDCWVREGSWLKYYPAQTNDYADLYWKEVAINKELRSKLDEIGRLANYE